MSSGGRSAEQQAVAEHNLEGQHQALLQELRDECGKDCKRPHRHTFNFAPPCVDPAMDENLTRNAQLSVLDLSPCRFEQHQPVEFGFRVQSLFEPAHGKPTKIVLQATPGELRPTPLELTNALIFVNADDEEKLALEEQVASLQRKLDGSLQRNLDDSLQRYLVAKQLRTELAEAHAENETHAAEVAACWGELDDSLQRNLGANELVKQLRTQLAEAHAEIETHEAEVAACCIFAAAEAKHRQRQYDQKMIDQLRVLLAIAFRQRDRADNEAKLAESEAAVQVQRSHALALASEKLPEEQVTSLQCCKFDGAVELACETSGMVQPPYKAFCVGGVLCGEYCTF